MEESSHLKKRDLQVFSQFAFFFLLSITSVCSYLETSEGVADVQGGSCSKSRCAVYFFFPDREKGHQITLNGYFCWTRQMSGCPGFRYMQMYTMIQTKYESDRIFVYGIFWVVSEEVVSFQLSRKTPSKPLGRTTFEFSLIKTMLSSFA